MTTHTAGRARKAALYLSLALLAVASRAVTIDRSWLEGSDDLRARLAELQDKAPPDLMAAKWLNSKWISVQSQRGKVVVIEFWATWSKSCLGMIPRNNALYEKYRGDGLLWIGVCSTQGGEIFEKVVKERGIKYPVCLDMTNFSDMRYAVDSYPDYYIIDRNGIIVAADCENDRVEDVIKLLLAEPYAP